MRFTYLSTSLMCRKLIGWFKEVLEWFCKIKWYAWKRGHLQLQGKLWRNFSKNITLRIIYKCWNYFWYVFKIYFATTLFTNIRRWDFHKTKRDKYIFGKYIFHHTVYDYFVKIHKYYFQSKNNIYKRWRIQNNTNAFMMNI